MKNIAQLHYASNYNIEMCHDMHLFIKGLFAEGMHLITIPFATRHVHHIIHVTISVHHMRRFMSIVNN
jgi:hypothetical protein